MAEYFILSKCKKATRPNHVYSANKIYAKFHFIRINKLSIQYFIWISICLILKHLFWFWECEDRMKLNHYQQFGVDLNGRFSFWMVDKHIFSLQSSGESR